MRFFLTSLIVCVIALHTPVLAQQKVRYSIRLESNNLYEIVDSNLLFIRPNSTYDSAAQEYDQRFPKVWVDFCKVYSKNERSKRNLYIFAREKYPYFSGLLQQLSPTIAIDFFGANEIYVLDSLTIEIAEKNVLQTKFMKDEAWYDIILPADDRQLLHFKLKSQLVFDKVGTTTLRWIGDPGLYKLRITFKLFENNHPYRLSTEYFYLRL